MDFAILVLLLVSTLVLAAIFTRRAKRKRLLSQSIPVSKAQIPQVHVSGVHRVSVSINSKTVEGQEMPEFAKNILASMGGAEGILNDPAVREALREATLHPDRTTAGIRDPFVPPAASPFDTGTNPFVDSQAENPFGTAAPAPNRPPPSARAGIENLGVAQVLAGPSLTFDGTRELSLELDAIGAPKRRVSATLADSAQQNYAAGDRTYVRLDPHDDSRVTLLSPEEAGNALPQGSNRMDSLVLWPQMFTRGAKGKAIVKTATQDASGVWRLELEVTPEQGWPYRAELATTVSTQEKQARLCVAGAQVPVLYDPDDPKTLCVDTVALGYGNPFAPR